MTTPEERRFRVTVVATDNERAVLIENALPDSQTLDMSAVAYEVEQLLAGRTVRVGRCACYCGGPGHSLNSGRCQETGRNWTLFTRPEHAGICEVCWHKCGHSSKSDL